MEKFACLLNLVFVVALNVSNDVYFDFFIDLDKHSGCDCIYSSTGSKKTGIYVDCFSEEEVVFESCKEWNICFFLCENLVCLKWKSEWFFSKKTNEQLEANRDWKNDNFLPIFWNIVEKL